MGNDGRTMSEERQKKTKKPSFSLNPFRRFKKQQKNKNRTIEKTAYGAIQIGNVKEKSRRKQLNNIYILV